MHTALRLSLVSFVSISLGACGSSSTPPPDGGSSDGGGGADSGSVDSGPGVDGGGTDGGGADGGGADSGPGTDAGPFACGDTTCGTGEICITGRCAGCCDVPPACIPVPSGCADGPLACGCFDTDPCGGCTECLGVTPDEIMCGNCMCACAAPWTAIDTPSGPRPIAELREGDLVLSVDHGEVVAVPIARINQRPVASHAVVHLTLASGATLDVSGRHPTADGRRLDALGPGDALGDEPIASVELVPYEEPFTYDILPASDTGVYFVAGAAIGSTLFAPEGERSPCW